ncbi:MAG: ABC transporter ATP-binding protein [Lachnospiraceae bacterium]|nr:ABC transporter ATP-binding protein [Lachnospiraceae bacterium]
MRQIWMYMKNYKKETVLAPLFKMLEACFELCVPLVIASITDVGIRNGDKGYAIKMGLVLLLLAAVGFGCSVVAQFFSARAAVGVATKLRHNLFKHIESFSFTEIDKVGTSTLITRMTSDVNQVQSGVNMMLRLFLRSPFIVFGAMIMAFTIDVKSALIFVVTIIVLLIVVFAIILFTIPMYKKVQAALDRVLGITRENLTGARVIRAFGMEDDEIEEYDNRTSLLFKLQVGVGRISALMNPVTLFIINGATIILVWTGAIQVNDGRLSQGEVIALVNYMSQILVELVKLANLIVTLTKAVACGNRIEGIFEMKSSLEVREITDEDNVNDSINMSTGCKEDTDCEYAVEYDNVSIKYMDSAEESMKDVSFKIRKGETVGVIGGTGSGKTTLIQAIPRFYDVCEGEIKVNGKNVKDYALNDLRDRIAVVLQKAVLFKGTIKENLLWGKEDATETEIYQALDRAQAREFVDKKEKGIEEMVEQGGRNLSGGQRQRLTIARALIRKPEILILDDSSSALDYATDAKLRIAIKELSEESETTVIIVSQRATSIMHADKIVVLDDGEVAGIGTHEELLENNQVYKEIYMSQNAVKSNN